MLSPTRTLSPRLNSAMQLVFARSLTSSEASAALRPFIFNVHPDLFAQFPEARSVNENSLKQLNGYLHELPQSRLRNPLPLTFYVRPNPIKNKQAGLNLKTITIHLSNDAYGTVKHILETCQLDTSHLPKSTTMQFSQPWQRLYDNYQKQGTIQFTLRIDHCLKFTKRLRQKPKIRY